MLLLTQDLSLLLRALLFALKAACGNSAGHERDSSELTSCLVPTLHPEAELF